MQDTLAGTDTERNFLYSSLGTYGTAGYMPDRERSQVLKENHQIRDVDGIILGLDLKRDTIISLPKDSRLNRKILPEYAFLYQGNNDFVGWVKIEDTRINYPVMSTPEAPEFYLHRDFYGFVLGQSPYDTI